MASILRCDYPGCNNTEGVCPVFLPVEAQGEERELRADLCPQCCQHLLRGMLSVWQVHAEDPLCRVVGRYVARKLGQRS